MSITQINRRIGLTDYFIPDLLPVLLGRFRRRYPHIHLEIQTDIGMNHIPLYEKGELDLVVAGKDAYQGNCRVLTQEPLIWVVGPDTETSRNQAVNLVLLPAPCSFRKIATESLDKAGRKWAVLITGTSIGSIQAAVQAGMGISILPKGALRPGLKKAPAHLELPELPMYTLALITDGQRGNDAREVFISYLEAALDNLNAQTLTAP